MNGRGKGSQVLGTDAFLPSFMLTRHLLRSRSKGLLLASNWHKKKKKKSTQKRQNSILLIAEQCRMHTGLACHGGSWLRYISEKDEKGRKGRGWEREREEKKNILFKAAAEVSPCLYPPTILLHILFSSSLFSSFPMSPQSRSSFLNPSCSVWGSLSCFCSPRCISSIISLTSLPRR